MDALKFAVALLQLVATIGLLILIIYYAKKDKENV